MDPSLPACFLLVLFPFPAINLNSYHTTLNLKPYSDTNYTKCKKQRRYTDRLIGEYVVCKTDCIDEDADECREGKAEMSVCQECQEAAEPRTD